MSKQAFIKGTIILTIASLITRILGFIFRIYMSRIMGSEGMGLYQLIFPVYMLIWAITSAGISLSISRKVAEFTAKGHHSDAIRVLKSAMVLSLMIAFPLSVFIYFSAPFIATSFLHAPDTHLALKYLSVCIPFMSIACCIRGYFQGRHEMGLSASAQIVEQVVRMAAIFLFASLFVSKGLVYICALGAIGLCCGEFASCLYTFILYKLKKRSLRLTPPTLRYNQLMGTLITIAIPITANRFLTSALHSIENILIPLQLQKGGLDTSTALSQYGMFTGMALPLLFFPSMITMSISTVLVPTISQAKATNNQTMLRLAVSKSIQFACLIGIGASALFLSLGKEIALACYHLDTVGVYLQILAIICPFVYLQSILNGMLNGLGLQRLTFKGTVLGSIVCISAILLLVPSKGIIGFIIAMLMQSCTITCYHLFHVLKHSSVSIHVVNWILKPAFAALVGTVWIKLIGYPFMAQYFNALVALFLSVGLLALFYLLLLFILKSITKEDILSVLP